MNDVSGKVSVIIPVFNRKIQLGDALASLQNQSCDQFEVVVVDDGSSEDIESVTRSFKKSLRLIYARIDNSGSPARPRNYGIELARNEWVAFLDSDDWWTPDKIEKVLQYTAQDVDVIYHKLLIAVDPDSAASSHTSCGWRVSGDPLVHLLTKGNFVPNSSAVFRKNALKDVGNISEEQPLVEDYDLAIRLAAHGARFLYIDKVLGYYRRSSDGISIPSVKNALGLQAVFEKANGILPVEYRAIGDAFASYSVGLGYLRSGDYVNASLHFKKSLATRSFRYKLRSLARLLAIIAIKIGRTKRDNHGPADTIR